jgi:hypothetical protein
MRKGIFIECMSEIFININSCWMSHHESCCTNGLEKALHSSCGERRGITGFMRGRGTLRETGRLYNVWLGALDAGVGAAAPPGSANHESCCTKRRRKALHSSREERAGDYRNYGVGEGVEVDGVGFVVARFLLSVMAKKYPVFVG